MKLNQVTLPVLDILKSVDFYLKLGFIQIVNSLEYARFSCPQGASTFSLTLSNEKFNNGAIIYFETENRKQLDDWVKLIITRGLEIKQMPTEQPYLWYEALIIDPSGNKIKLYCAGDNRLNPAWKINKKFRE